MAKWNNPKCGFQKGHLPYKGAFKKGKGSGLFGSKHPKWKGGKIQQICIICHQSFEDWASRKRKYCSRKCFLEDLHKQNRRGRWINCKFCNKKFYIPKSRIGKGRYCSNKCKHKWLGEQQRGQKTWWNTGKNHWNWKGGITPERTKIYFSKKYRDWIKKVYKRDNYTCQKCGDNSGII